VGHISFYVRDSCICTYSILDFGIHPSSASFPSGFGAGDGEGVLGTGTPRLRAGPSFKFNDSLIFFPPCPVPAPMSEPEPGEPVPSDSFPFPFAPPKLREGSEMDIEFRRLFGLELALPASRDSIISSSSSSSVRRRLSGGAEGGRSGDVACRGDTGRDSRSRGFAIDIDPRRSRTMGELLRAGLRLWLLATIPAFVFSVFSVEKNCWDGRGEEFDDDGDGDDDDDDDDAPDEDEDDGMEFRVGPMLLLRDCIALSPTKDSVRTSFRSGLVPGP